MKNKVVLITGATAGIGLQTAKELVKLGASVHFIARNKTKAIGVREILIQEGEGRPCSFYIADLSSQKSIVEVAKQIKKDLPKIDVLINNAGAVFSDFELTEDGVEKTIATNHIAYYLLTECLMNQLKSSPEARIVNVSSGSNRYGKINLKSFTEESGYQIMKAYAQSKLANILYTKYLASQLDSTHITVNCLHPGRINTNIGNKNTSGIASFVWSLTTKFGAESVQEGAMTSVFLASSPKMKGVSGKYFSKCKEDLTYNKIADDIELQQALWEKTEELCKSALINLY